MKYQGPYCDAVIPATDDDWADEHLSLKMAVHVVNDVSEAVAHINKYGTKHTECIVTSSPESESAKYFKQTVDAPPSMSMRLPGLPMGLCTALALSLA